MPSGFRRLYERENMVADFQSPVSNNRKHQGHARKSYPHLKVPPYSTFAVPFRWMLRQYQEEIGGYRGGAALLAMPRSWSASSARASRA